MCSSASAARNGSIMPGKTRVWVTAWRSIRSAIFSGDQPRLGRMLTVPPRRNVGMLRSWSAEALYVGPVTSVTASDVMSG